MDAPQVKTWECSPRGRGTKPHFGPIDIFSHSPRLAGMSHKFLRAGHRRQRLDVEDAVRFDLADSAPRAAITSSKPQNVSDAPLAPSRRATP
jgi:hypothetical protein